ncbi:MAG: MFS transporter [Chloroflexi bacterium]|nr:MAG: MFS transporter [Chloroflexota bacterium]
MMRSVTGWLGGIAAGLSRNLKLVSLSLFFWGFGEGLFYDYVPLHLRDLGADAVQTGYVIALFSFGLAVTMLPAGIAADRYGPHISLRISWPLGIVAMLIIAFTDTLGWFTLGWFLFGCSGFVIPPLTRYITDGRGELTPQRALTLVFSSFSAGFMISPTIGGWIAQSYGLRSTFYLALVMVVASTVVILFTRPLAHTPTRINRDYLSLLHNRRFMGFMLLVFFGMFALQLGVPLTSRYLQETWLLSLPQIGILGSVLAFGEFSLGFALGGLPPRRVFAVLQAAGIVYALLLLSTGSLPLLAIAFFLRAGVGISRRFVDAISMRVVPVQQHGLAFGLSATVTFAAGMLAPAAAGWLYSIDRSWPLQASILLLPVAAVLTYLLAPRPVDGIPAPPPIPRVIG